ncbi:hypothetical protein LIER_21757 [Lithospermum erythrorhizon]|uniref:CRM domain-containing protein n=1 Tax=Lithospermum erythrorhizon TaxID=34254 RepID=A0AAV3QX42_LITER
MGAIPLPLPSPSSTHLLLRRLLRPFPLFNHHISLLSTTTPPPHLLPLHTSTTTSLPPFFTPPSLPFSTPQSQNDVLLDNQIDTDEDKVVDFYQNEVVDFDEDKVVVDFDEDKVVVDSDEDEEEKGGKAKPPPSLSIKEKKELASYAHSLGKKLKSQQVGKSGVTHTVITALLETLEKNELLKIKIHGNCPAELADAVRQIEMGTGSVAVSQIGRTVILYRPSVTKLQAEQKKKLARRNLMKKNSVWIRSSPKSKEETPKLSARGRRGSSRLTNAATLQVTWYVLAVMLIATAVPSRVCWTLTARIVYLVCSLQSSICNDGKCPPPLAPVAVTEAILNEKNPVIEKQMNFTSRPTSKMWWTSYGELC